MNQNSRLNLLAVTAIAMSLNASLGGAQVLHPNDGISNRSVANSPRAMEAFPWLMRNVTESRRSKDAITPSTSALEVVKENSALAASPRMKEQFPELTRSAALSSGNTVATRPGIHPLNVVKHNSALAASPRMKELYPELAHGKEKSFPLAPLK